MTCLRCLRGLVQVVPGIKIKGTWRWRWLAKCHGRGRTSVEPRSQPIVRISSRTVVEEAGDKSSGGRHGRHISSGWNHRTLPGQGRRICPNREGIRRCAKGRRFDIERSRPPVRLTSIVTCRSRLRPRTACRSGWLLLHAIARRVVATITAVLLLNDGLRVGLFRWRRPCFPGGTRLFIHRRSSAAFFLISALLVDLSWLTVATGLIWCFRQWLLLPVGGFAGFGVVEVGVDRRRSRIGRPFTGARPTCVRLGRARPSVRNRILSSARLDVDRAAGVLIRVLDVSDARAPVRARRHVALDRTDCHQVQGRGREAFSTRATGPRAEKIAAPGREGRWRSSLCRG